jgi:hypothetical protein
MLEAIGMLGNSGGHDPAARSVAKVSAQAATLRRQLQPFGGKKLTPAVPYPTVDALLRWIVRGEAPKRFTSSPV